ncbi:MAG: hypothetical protein QNJ41_25155 [Xenococcaceae cyanobacterium MO_188.B32]|nr:hypothetical protein [Xenococcaceae cyanobacterium MO_188.B32]
MNSVQTKHSIDILLCEDNLGDVYIITDFLQNSDREYNLHHVTNGEAAIDYLEQLILLAKAILTEFSSTTVTKNSNFSLWYYFL